MQTTCPQKVRVHTFGQADEPDVSVATALSAQQRIDQIRFPLLPAENESWWSLAERYAAQTELIEPVSSCLRLGWYANLHDSDSLMIDGGFGECARRQYLNRVALAGGSAVRRRDVLALARRLRILRADVFLDEVAACMEQGIVEDLSALFASMPPVESIGIGNYLDLMAVRMRIPNWGGPEQARLDGMVLNFMPMAQPSFLREVFGTRIAERKNGRLVKRYIRMHQRPLAHVPLVKGGVRYSFGLSTAAAHVVTSIKGRVVGRSPDTGTGIFLARMRDAVQELLCSPDVAQSGLYRLPALRRMVADYYGGDASLRMPVIWWLTFELWRRSLRTGR